MYDHRQLLQSPQFMLEVSKGNVEGYSFIHKFGENPATGTSFEDVWDGGGTYTYSSSSVIHYISSSNALDDQEVTVIGLDANWNEQTINVDLNGQTKTQIGTGETYIRIYRAYNNNGTDIQGDVYIYEDDTITAGVPDTASKIRAKIIAGNNQTLMALYTIPANNTGFIYQWNNSILSKTAVSGACRGFMRFFGGVFLLKHSGGFSESNNFDYDFRIPLKVPPKTDLAVRHELSAEKTSSSQFLVLLVQNNFLK